MKKEWKKLQTDSMVLDDSLADTKDTFAQLSTAQVCMNPWIFTWHRRLLEALMQIVSHAGF